jgi:hypothetical protein
VRAGHHRSTSLVRRSIEARSLRFLIRFIRPLLAMFKAFPLSIWYDLSDVMLADALDDRASCRRFCGFSGAGTTPERTAFVCFRKELVGHQLDRLLFTASRPMLGQMPIRHWSRKRR